MLTPLLGTSFQGANSTAKCTRVIVSVCVCVCARTPARGCGLGSLPFKLQTVICANAASENAWPASESRQAGGCFECCQESTPHLCRRGCRGRGLRVGACGATPAPHHPSPCHSGASPFCAGKHDEPPKASFFEGNGRSRGGIVQQNVSLKTFFSQTRLGLPHLRQKARH